MKNERLKSIVSTSKEDTIKLGFELAKKVQPGMVFCLKGDLGAGKTTLTKGIAKGLNIQKNITSPTFNILKIYNGDIPLYHFDAYRLEGITQDLGFDEYIDGDGLCVIEWSDNLSDLLDEYLLVNITIDDEDNRHITLSSNSPIYDRFLEV